MMRPSMLKSYLSQHADPSEGWAQQAPLFSSFDDDGVQHALSFAGCAQQAVSTTGSSVFFSSVAIVCVPIFFLFSVDSTNIFKDGDPAK
jgi:hypothetical protein